MTSSRGAGRTITLAAFTTTIGMIGPFLLSAQAMWIGDDLGLTEASLGVGVSSFFGSAAIAAILLSRSRSNWLTRQGYRTGAVFIAIGALGVATLATGSPLIAFFMCLVGVGNAILQFTANLFMASVLKVHRRGLGFGIKQSSGPIALTAAGLVIPSIGATYGWRASFIGLSLVGFLLAGSVNRFTPGDRTVDATQPPKRLETGDRPPAMPVLLCASAMVLGSAAGNFFVAFSPSWLNVNGYSVEAASLLVGAGGILCCLVRVVLGFTADHRHGGILKVIACQFFAGAVLLGAIAVVDGPQLGVIVAAAFAIGWSWPGLLLFAVVRVSRDRPGVGTGPIQAGAFAGGALGPMLLGGVVSSAGYATAWMIACGLFVGGAVLLMLGRREFRRDLRARPPSGPLGYGGGWSAPRMTAGGDHSAS